MNLTYNIEIDGKKTIATTDGVLGKGSFGTVFKAKLGNKIVAFKREGGVLKGESNGLFTEIKAISKLGLYKKTIEQMPFVFGSGFVNDENSPKQMRFIALELLDSEIMKGIIPVSRVAYDMLKACDYLNNRGRAQVNVDIKRENICYRHSDNTFVMIDFDLTFDMSTKFLSIRDTIEGTREFASNDSIAGCDLTKRGQLQNLFFAILSMLVKTPWNEANIKEYFDEENVTSNLAITRRIQSEIISIKRSLFPCLEGINEDNEDCVSQMFSFCGMQSIGPLYELALHVFGMAYFDDIDYKVLLYLMEDVSLGRHLPTDKFGPMGVRLFRKMNTVPLGIEYGNHGDVPSEDRPNWVRAIMNKYAHVFRVEDARMDQNIFTAIETYTMGTKVINFSDRGSFKDMFSTMGGVVLPPKEIKSIVTFLDSDYSNFAKLLKSATKLEKLHWYNDSIDLNTENGLTYGKTTVKQPFYNKSFYGQG